MVRIWSPENSTLNTLPVRAVLASFSFLYGGLVGLRSFLYRSGIFGSRRLEAWVISIGNLTVGGTGKTPLVIALAEYLRRKGLRTGVLSRGYKGRRVQDTAWVCDGENMLGKPDAVGEEPYLIAWRLKDIPVAVGKDRYRAGRMLLERHAAEVLILDDAFQHLSIFRDMNLLVIDATAPFGPRQASGWLLPRGTLRESPRGIRRASAVLVSRMEQYDQIQEKWQELVGQIRRYNPQVPVFQAFFRPTKLISLPSGKEEDLNLLKDRSILAFSGIGNPASFRFFLEERGAKVVKEVVFEDHHQYGQKEIHELIRSARNERADFLVTTEKDAVKIQDLLSPADRVSALRIELDRIEEPQAWERFIGERLGVSKAQD